MSVCGLADTVGGMPAFYVHSVAKWRDGTAQREPVGCVAGGVFRCGVGGGIRTRPGAGARRPRRAASIGIVSVPSSPRTRWPRPGPAARGRARAPGRPDEAAERGGVGALRGRELDADAGVPDGFERLWTPHRLAYIKGAGKPTGPGAHEGCPFCIAPTLSDEDGLIVARGELVYAIMNLYPYNSGHVLICPYRHLADYTELTRAETAEFSDYTTRAITALRTRVRAARLQHRDEPGHGGRRGDRRPPAPARGAALGRRHQLHAGDRPHPRAAPAPRRHPQAAGRRLAAGASRRGRPLRTAPPSTTPRRRWSAAAGRASRTGCRRGRPGRARRRRRPWW